MIDVTEMIMKGTKIYEPIIKNANIFKSVLHILTHLIVTMTL